MGLSAEEVVSLKGIMYFFTLAQQALDLVEYFWPITLLLAIAWVWSLAVMEPVPNGSRLRILCLGCLPPFAFPFAILVFGAIFVSEPPIGVEAPVFPRCIITALLLAELPLAVLMSFRWGKRWPAIATSWVCAGYLSLAAGLISTMSVTGIWL